jgi:hypothetical protein
MRTFNPAEHANRAEAGGFRDHLARREERALELELLPVNDANERALQDHAASAVGLAGSSGGTRGRS